MKTENPYVNESSSSYSNEDKVVGAGVYYNNNASDDGYLYSEEGKSEVKSPYLLTKTLERIHCYLSFSKNLFA